MKARNALQPQQASRVIEARALPDDWLDTMQGKAWLDQKEAEAEMQWLASEAEADAERLCLSDWEGW